MSGPLATEADLAARFGIGVEMVTKFRQRYHWPSVKFGRFEVRFTEDQIEQIIAQHTDDLKRAALQVTAPGQTKRSAARRRSA